SAALTDGAAARDDARRSPPTRAPSLSASGRTGSGPAFAGLSGVSITTSSGCAGQFHDDAAARRLPLADEDRSSVGIDDPACDREAETGAAVARRARRVHAVEALEHALALGDRDARPLVGDLDRRDAVRRRVRAQPHAAVQG